jgi:hypothetical protein
MIGVNGAKSLGVNFTHLPTNLHTFHLNLR